MVLSQREETKIEGGHRRPEQKWIPDMVPLLHHAPLVPAEEKIRTQSSGDLSSEIINKFTSSNIPIPGEPFKETSFLFLIPFTHHTARPFWHTSGLLLHCFEAVLTGAWNPIHDTAWPSEWDTALNI